MSEIAKNANTTLRVLDYTICLWAALVFIQMFAHQGGGVTAIKLTIVEAAIPSHIASLAMHAAIWLLPLYGVFLLDKAGEAFRMLPEESRATVRTFASLATFRKRGWSLLFVGCTLVYQLTLLVASVDARSGIHPFIGIGVTLVYLGPAAWLLICLYRWHRLAYPDPE